MILTVTVAIIMALDKGVGKPLKNYLQNNVIELVGCMLRTGEYPNVSFGLCQGGDLLKFSFSSHVGDGGSSGGDGQGGRGSNKGSNSNQQDSSSNKGGSSDSSGGDKNSENSSSSSGEGNSNRFRNRSSGGSGGIDQQPDFEDFSSNTRQISLESSDGEAGQDGEFSSAGKFEDDSGTTTVVRRIRKNERIGGSFLISEENYDEETEITSEGGGTRKVSTPLAMREEGRGPSAFTIQPEKKKTYKKKDDGGFDFSFMNILKWILIGGILVVFGVFAFAQLNSIRKGWTDS